MRYLIGLLGAFVAFGSWADNRVEVGNNTGGHHCHIQWNQDNADDEYKEGCKAKALQNTDGTYTGWAREDWTKVPASIYPGALPDRKVWQTYFKTDCTGTAGTVQDDDANTYTSGDCTTEIWFRGHPRLGGTEVYRRYKMEIRNAAAAADTAKAMSEAAGTSVMMREGMGYKSYE